MTDLYSQVLNFFPNLRINDCIERKGKIFYLHENYSVCPHHYDLNKLKQYKAVITYNSKLYDIFKEKGLNVFKLDGYVLFNMDAFGSLDSGQFADYNNKISGISLHCKFRDSYLSWDIAGKRFDVFKEIAETGKIVTDYYGMQCNSKLEKYYKGWIGMKGQSSCWPNSIEEQFVINKYKFNLCFENVYHELWSYDYISERIFSCFRAKTIPIYWGCYNIQQYIPKELFIDFREYKDDINGLVDYMLSIDADKYYKMTNAAFDFEKNCKYGRVKNLIEKIKEIEGIK